MTKDTQAEHIQKKGRKSINLSPQMRAYQATILLWAGWDFSKR